MAVNGLKVLASFLFHPTCYKKENIRSCNIYSYKLVSKNGLGWAPWFPEWVLRKKMETYWSCGNAPTLFFSCVHSSLERTLLNQRGLHNRRCKTTRRRTKKGGRKEKEKQAPGHFSCASFCLFVCLSAVRKHLHIFKEYHFLRSFKDIWMLSLGSGLRPQPQLDGNHVLLLPKIIGSDQITDVLCAHN